MKRLSIGLAAGALFAAVAAGGASNPVSAAPAASGARNVILFVGDGMGISTVTAARILEGQLDGKSGEGNELSFELFPRVGLSQVHNFDSQVPDSAGTMTAMMAGKKTDRGLINVDRHGVRGNCATIAGNELTSWFMTAEIMGLATGVVTTARLSHATPAATYAVAIDRNHEADVDLPPGCNQPDIASQLIDFPYGDGIEVALGGGRRNFLPKTTSDPEETTKKGRRSDGRNLAAEWAARPDATYVWNQAQFDAVDLGTTNHLLGIFERGHMEYELDRSNDGAGEPSLTEMTEMAIAMLSRDDDGFVLVVEAGRIDHAHHATNAHRALTETIELSDAVARALEMVDTEETLVIVTADHSHGLTISGYPDRGNDILGLENNDDGSDGLPYTTLNYATGPERHLESDGSRADLSQIDTTDPDFQQAAAIPRDGAAHTGEDVPIYATGPRAGKFGKVLGQPRIGKLILDALLRFHGG